MRRVTVAAVVACVLAGSLWSSSVAGAVEAEGTGQTLIRRTVTAPGTESFLQLRVKGTPGRAVRLVVGDTASAPIQLDGYWQRAGISLPGSAGEKTLHLRSVGAFGSEDDVTVEGMSVSAASATTSTVTPGTRIVNVNGQPFVGRGYTYWTVPIGEQWPASTWADSAACQRDASLLRSAGVTLVRLPFEDHEPTVRDQYRACLDAFHAGGIRVLWLIDPPGQQEKIVDSPAFIEAYADKIETAVRDVGDHPATAFWTIGNEIERVNDDDPRLWLGNKSTGRPAMLETLIQRTKAADGGRHLVGTSICCPLMLLWLETANVPSLDFWGLNAYDQPLSGTWFADLNNADPRPKMLTETGGDRYHCFAGVQGEGGTVSCRTSYRNPAAHSGERQAAQRDWNVRLWDNVAANLSGSSTPSGALFGATYFMWSDLWWFSLGGITPLAPSDHDVVGGFFGGRTPDGIANFEWFGATHAQPAGATEPRVTSLAFDALATRWSSTAPPTMSNVNVTVLGPNVTVSWNTSEPATSELQIGVNGETNRDGGDMLKDNTIFRRAVHQTGLRTSHSITVLAPTSDPALCQKVVPRSFTADGRSVTTNPRIAGCPSTGRFE